MKVHCHAPKWVVSPGKKTKSSVILYILAGFSWIFFSWVLLLSQRDKSQWSFVDHELLGPNTYLLIRDCDPSSSIREKKRELTLYRGIYFVWYDNAWMTSLEWRDYTIKICKGEIQLLEKEVGLRSCLLVHPPNRHGSQVVGTQSQLALWIAGIKLCEPGPAAAGSSRQKAEVWLERMHALWGGT